MHDPCHSVEQASLAGCEGQSNVNSNADIFSGSPDELRRRLQLAASVMRKLHTQKVQLECELASLRRSVPTPAVPPSGATESSTAAPVLSEKPAAPSECRTPAERLCAKGPVSEARSQALLGVGSIERLHQRPFACASTPGVLPMHNMAGAQPLQIASDQLSAKGHVPDHLQATERTASGFSSATSAGVHSEEWEGGPDEDKGGLQETSWRAPCGEALGDRNRTHAARLSFSGEVHETKAAPLRLGEKDAVVAWSARRRAAADEGRGNEGRGSEGIGNPEDQSLGPQQYEPLELHCL